MTSLLVAAAMLVLIYLGNASLFRPIRLDARSKTMLIGGSRFPIAWASGVLVEYREAEQKWLDRGIPFGGPAVDRKYLTAPGPYADRLEQFTIAAPGWPAPITVSNADDRSPFERLQGKRLTALWVTTVERKYLEFRGPSERLDHPDVVAALQSLIKPGFWAHLPAMVLGFVWGASAVSALFGLAGALVALPVYRAFFRAVAAWRRRSFRDGEVERLMRAIATGSVGATSLN